MRNFLDDDLRWRAYWRGFDDLPEPSLSGPDGGKLWSAWRCGQSDGGHLPVSHGQLVDLAIWSLKRLTAPA